MKVDKKILEIMEEFTMAFNPAQYQAPEGKKLPVLLLLDVSSSMKGIKIAELYDATKEMVRVFVEERVKEVEIEMAIITFGDQVTLQNDFKSVTDLEENGIQPFEADGYTPLGTALSMAKGMLEDRSILPKNIYKPAVVLVSDGMPNDQWEEPLHLFISEGRSSKCQRFAVGIGDDVDLEMLLKFTGDEKMLLKATEAHEIGEKFNKITMSVTQRSKSVNPNKTVLSVISNDTADVMEEEIEEEFEK